MDEDLFGVFESKTPKRKTNPSSASEEPVKRPRTEAATIQPNAPVETSTTHTPAQKIVTEDLNAGGTFGDESDRKACSHEVCLPPNYTESEMALDLEGPKDPVRKYPFVLDPFQKVSIACLEKGQSVLVSAHTSAGKTVIAEYAIAMALRDKQRVVYTSPIKALSNQKYRELYEEFQDVGLMTGDITINPCASCLVMTTEILRSMLYRGSEILREIGWVIFDEIHYMRDKERGVVWEETIILLPDTCRFVFLSATIPNAREFAHWIAKIHNQPCHVVYTDYRPTPLQHYIFPAGGNGLHLVVDEKGKFREDNFQAALAALTPTVQTRAPKGGQKGGSDIYKIVKLILARNFHPCIVFSFSKKQCEYLAMQMQKLEMNTDVEKDMVSRVFNNAIDTLSEEDKKLPQIQQLLPLLRRGIGIHHSGLLPLLKEIIEILFQEGLLKCLFATETFSIGLNMPAKTVVFTSVRKFDGQDFRWISGGEYIQMSGRAGRRGLDDKGIVIMMVDEKMEPSVAQGMVKGRSDVLLSSFHIGYNMLLNLLRVEGIDPTYMLRQSFHQFQNDRELPLLREKVLELETTKNNIQIPDDKLNIVADLYQTKSQQLKQKADVRRIVTQPVYALPFLQQGRLAKVKEGNVDWGWGVVVNFLKQTKAVETADVASLYIVDVLLRCQPNSDANATPVPFQGEGTPDMQVISVLLPLLDGISSVRIYIPKDLHSAGNRATVHVSLTEVEKRFPDGIPLLDPIDDMKIEDPTFSKILRNIETLEDKLKRTTRFHYPGVEEHLSLYEQRASLEDQIKETKRKIRTTDNVILKDDLKAMKQVLKRLGFLTKENAVDVKGRVACEINTSDELVLSELLFSGFFNELTLEQIPALLSCFVFDEKSQNNFTVQAELSGPFRQLQDIARHVAEVSREAKLDINVDDYVKKFRPELMDVVLAWCRGSTFAQICGMTPVFEGSIIRCMRRLEELMKQLMNAAKTIGNTEIESKVSEAIQKMRRDIVFAASLYL